MSEEARIEGAEDFISGTEREAEPHSDGRKSADSRGKVLLIGPVNLGELQEDDAKFRHIAGLMTALGFEVLNFSSDVFSSPCLECDMAVLLDGWETSGTAREDLGVVLAYGKKIMMESDICHL